MSRVLIVGPPRSGTTWIGQTLGRAHDACYVHEPDGDNEVYALRVKRGRPRHVELVAGDEWPEYERLWQGAFAGGSRPASLRDRVAERLFESTPRAVRREVRRGSRAPVRLAAALRAARPLRPRGDVAHVVVKSVHACLAVEWIAARFAPRVVVVERHPLNVLASWDELGQGADVVEYGQLREVARRRWATELPADDAPRIVRRAAFLGVLQGALREGAAAHPEWVTVRHEDLSGAPEARFAELCERVGLAFSPAAAEYLRESDRPGEGYATQRVASSLAQRWRARLSAEEVALALEALDRFPADLHLLDAATEGPA